MSIFTAGLASGIKDELTLKIVDYGYHVSTPNDIYLADAINITALFQYALPSGTVDRLIIKLLETKFKETESEIIVTTINYLKDRINND